MVEIYPEILRTESHCPRCYHLEKSVPKLFFWGVHVLGRYTCQSCRLAFLGTLPSGHTSLFPVSFSTDKKYRLFDRKSAGWLAFPLIDAVSSGKKIEGNIQIFNPGLGKDLILINCLDTCFGHVFTKVWNVYFNKSSFQEIGIAVLIPDQYQWLLPKEVEIWSVKTNLEALSAEISGLDQWVKAQFKRFRKVYLHPVPVHVNHQGLDFEKILGIKPFDLDFFSTTSPNITFVWRADRFWLNNNILYFFDKASRKYQVENFFQPIFAWRQEQLVMRLTNKIIKKLPYASFTITGVGKTGSFPSFIKDWRQGAIDWQVEQDWNHIFRKSHVVRGVHGSHMLIPTALSAGFVEILPRYKIDHLTEDISQAHSSRLSHFLGRFVDEYATPDLISMHVVSMVKKFGFIKKNMEA
jgi:hypothetical protein